ncbi:sensor histidine kinase [Rubrivivax gelatinosus]|uniref:histidine kinase n=1 Tax=Rubrivivax gelatinosus (strain NBRC 100245 / IL144) TaxID=983917 RepID=I0HVH4_RUBGI|nr:HAMP domain-containing sensor histidine kinase [Rubrivivax gelatinosus]BAL97011.1 sensor protein [Rubrivivax gelatinosus IL144]
MNGREPSSAASEGDSPWGLAAWLALAVLVSATVSMVIARQPGSIATIWFANAIGVAALAHQPRRRWPLLLAAAGAANAVANLLQGDAPLMALSFVPPNLLEMALGAWGVQRARLPERGLRSAPALATLLVVGGLLPQLAGATLGTAMLAPQGLDAVEGVWLPWYEGSVIGAMSVLPLAFIVCRDGPATLTAGWDDTRLVVLLPLSVGLTLLALAQVPFPFIYLTLPLLLGAFVLSFTALLALTLVVSLTVALALGTGVFVPPPRLAAWQTVYVYLAYAAALVPPQLLAAAQADLHDARERLEARSQELRRANDGLEQFVRIASHDLREPLNTVVQFGSLLEHDEAEHLSEPGRRYLGLMLQATRRMRTLLDDVLQYVRMQRGEPPATQPVALGPLLDEVLLALAASIRERGADVHVADLPTVHGNRALLSLLFQNLLSNALKFVPPERTPRVRVSADVDAGVAWISIVDNGIGIAPADQDKLFQPFRRLNLRRRYDGTGLGLALARQIVEAHGGAIELESEPDRGSCFSVRLPLA